MKLFAAFIKRHCRQVDGITVHRLNAYHPGYFAAYALDPDGNNIEAVFHGPVQRSAESVVLSPVWADT